MTLDQHVQPNVESLNNTPRFVELKLSGGEAPWCVDGRPDYQKSKGPQMLGGSLQPVVLKTIWNEAYLDRNFVLDSLNKLKESGFVLGVHWGSHHVEGKASDCGFADKLRLIIAKAREEKPEISRRLRRLYKNNPAAFEALGMATETDFLARLEDAYKKINAFGDNREDRVKIYGEELINTGIEAGAEVENLEGEHGEKAAFVNLKEGVTLDTNRLNKEGQPAFNLDLWAAVKQAEILGVGGGFARVASLILYQATEMVLVEDNGKPALEVIIHT